MTLFNYDNCPCKHEYCKSVVALAHIFPGNVCTLMGGYIKTTCFDCWYLMNEEEHFMRDKNIPEEGLEKAELQLTIIEQMQNNDITPLTGSHYDMKQYIDRIFDKHEVKERLKNGKNVLSSIKTILKK